MRILFLTHRLPYAPNRGDRIRAYHMLRTLGARARIDLVSLVHDAEEAGHAADLRDFADSVTLARVRRVRNWVRAAGSLVTPAPVTHALLNAPGLRADLERIVATNRPSAVLAYCSGMARFALLAPLAGLPLIVDFVDVDSRKWRALAPTAAYPLNWIYRREARYLARFEARAARCAFASLVVNERERTALAEEAPDARIEVVPNGVDVEYFRPRSEPPATSDVVFCGVMDYSPNEDAAVWLGRAVWPLVRQVRGDVRLWLVGSNPTPRLRRLAHEDSSIRVTGRVQDVRPYLWNAAVATAPLRVSRGIQNKVLEAIAAGLPAVITAQVAEGLPPGLLAGCCVADEPVAFARAIVHYLLFSPDQRRAMTQGVDLSALSWCSRLAPLPDLLEAASRAAEEAPRGWRRGMTPMKE